MFESPRSLLKAGILAIGTVFVSLVAQQPLVRGALEAGMAALAEMPAVAFMHRELSTIPWWAEGALALFGLVAAIALRMNHRPAPSTVPTKTPASPTTIPLADTRNVLIVTPSIQITTTPTTTPGVTPQVNVVVTVQSVIGGRTPEREELPNAPHE